MYPGKHFLLARLIPSVTIGGNLVTEDIDFLELGKSISDELGKAENEEIEIIDQRIEFDVNNSNFFIVLTCKRKWVSA